MAIKKVSIGNSKCYTIINFYKTHRQFVIVIVDKNKIQRIHKNRCKFDECVTDSVDPIKRKDLQIPMQSGYVIFMVGIMASLREEDVNKLYYNKFVDERMKKYKPNIMVAPNYIHHSAPGACCAFGNNMDYCMIIGVPIDTFTNVIVKNEMKQKAIEHES